MAAGAAAAVADRVGLGWRADLAAGILGSLDRVDLVEVIADDWVDLPRRKRRALATLAAQVPVVLHGVGLGLASAEPVAETRLAAFARLASEAGVERWSEHLAFVRGGGVEIGHLAAPPRTESTLDGAAKNLQRAARVVGALPEVENVATLIDPPGSDRDELAWISGVLAASGAAMLLDLHNLHANAVNFGFDARAFLDRFPLERVRTIHLAGGRWIRAPGGGSRLLDDHQHTVPPEVYELLAYVAARAPQPLDVILERDGRFESVAPLLAELDRARSVLALARAAPVARTATVKSSPAAAPASPSSGETDSGLTRFLARLYVDEDLRRRFLADPRAESRRERLPDHESDALAGIDRDGLALAAASFARKRASAR